jgi:uncharacterized Tic20 family protein
MTLQAPAAATAQPTTTPSQEDRGLAAAAHLSFFVGFWLAAPIAIYAIKRKESRFVAHQAAQAALVQILFGGGSFVAAIVFFIAGVAAGIIGDKHGVVAALIAIVPMLAISVGGLAVVVVHLVAAYRAWQGQRWSIPIAGRLADAIVNADEGAAKV